MKPDAYMRFYWNEFWSAVEGQSDQTIIAYLRAISHYYHHNHCVGLKDDSEFLRKLCRVDKAEWGEVCAIIFDNDRFFTQDANGLWQQKRAQEEWLKSVEHYDKAIKRAKLGAKARWK